VIGQRKIPPRKSWINTYFFYCSRESGLYAFFRVSSLFPFPEFRIRVLFQPEDGLKYFSKLCDKRLMHNDVARLDAREECWC
jgi:hypothetical protein